MNVKAGIEKPWRSVAEELDYFPDFITQGVSGVKSSLDYWAEFYLTRNKNPTQTRNKFTLFFPLSVHPVTRNMPTSQTLRKPYYIPLLAAGGRTQHPYNLTLIPPFAARRRLFRMK